MRVFIELADSGSFTLVSKKLGISQPAVSQNIASLEQSIGDVLFVRSRGQEGLTEKGRILLEYAKKISYWYGRIERELVRGEKPEKPPTILDISEGHQAEITVEDGIINIKLKQ